MLSSKGKMRLGDYVVHQKGFAFKSSQYISVGYPIIRVSNFTDRSVDISNLFFISTDSIQQYNKFKVRCFDVVIATVGSWPANPGSIVGKTICIPQECEGALLNQNAVILRAKNELEQKYLFYLLKTKEFQEHVVSKAQGSANQASITLDDIFSFEFELPSLEKQNFIICQLRTLDDKIELNRKMNETLEAMAQALFKSWFVDFESVATKEMYKSVKGIIPKGWNIEPISKYLVLSYGKSLPEKNRRKGKVPVYGSGGITGHHDEALITEKTIIVGRKGTVGSLFWESRPCFPIDTVFYVQPILPLIFCYYLLKSLPLRSMNTDAAVPGLNRENVYRLEFPMPPSELVSVFSKISDMLRAKMHANFQEIGSLINLRDTLLPKLISGQLRIKDAEKILGKIT